MYVWQTLSTGVHVNVVVEEWAPFYGFVPDEDGEWSSNEMTSPG